MKPIAIVLSLLFSVTVLLSDARAAAPAPVGKIAAVAGTVQLERGGKRYRLPQGASVYNGDVLTTGKASVAKLLLNDESVISIGAATRFQVNGFATSTSSRRGAFRMWYGKMKAAVSKFVAGPTDFKFQTPTAVAGVRGTTLVLEHDRNTNQSTLTVIEGTVVFAPANTREQSSVVVSTRQQSRQGNGGNPSQPRAVSHEEAGSAGDGFDANPADKDDPKNESGSSDGDGDPGSTGDGSDGADGDEPPPPSGEDLLDRTETIHEQVPVDATQRPTDNPVADPTAGRTGIRVRW